MQQLRFKPYVRKYVVYTVYGNLIYGLNLGPTPDPSRKPSHRELICDYESPPPLTAAACVVLQFLGRLMHISIRGTPGESAHVCPAHCAVHVKSVRCSVWAD